MNDATNNNINEKWQMLLWRVSAVLSVIILILDIVISVGYNDDDGTLSKGVYILMNTVIPVIVYAASNLATFYVIKKKKLNDEAADWIISLLLLIVIIVPSIQYYDVLVFILIPVAAIIMTGVFANQNITLTVTAATLVTVIINDMRLKELHIWDEYGNTEWVVSSVCMVIIVCAVVMMVNAHTKELVQSIEDSSVKQKNLMTELKKDPLTSLYNRRSFEESLENEIQKVEETGKKSFIAIFDIDHFKNVNDTYGHSNGDIVIKALCKMLKDKSKDCGLAFRYGGEEFVILFSDVELSKVINVVEDVRTEFRCYYFQFMNDSGITCSCGVAEYIPGESAKAWFNRADSSLYKAKDAGRNRTVVSE